MKRLLLLISLFFSGLTIAQISPVSPEDSPTETLVGKVSDISSGDVLSLHMTDTPNSMDIWVMRYTNPSLGGLNKIVEFSASPDEMRALYGEMTKTMRRTRTLKPTQYQDGRKLLEMNLGTNYMSVNKENLRKWRLVFHDESRLNSFAFNIEERQLAQLFGTYSKD